MRDFGGDFAKFDLCLGEAADCYGFYLDEPEGPRDELIAILKGAGFDEKDGWLIKDVKRSDIRSQAIALARAFAQ